MMMQVAIRLAALVILSKKAKDPEPPIGGLAEKNNSPAQKIFDTMEQALKQG
jgi:hypothetical protein